MSRCPVCSTPLARKQVQVRESFACPTCRARIGVAAWHRWSVRALAGFVAGCIAGVIEASGGAAFAALVALAVAASDLPVGPLPLVRVWTRGRARLGRALLDGAAVGVCAALPYALLRALGA